MKILEMQVARKVRETGKTVEWVVEAKYGAHPSIPEEIHVRAFVDGVRFIKEEIKNIP